MNTKSIFISSITAIVVIATAVGFFISYQTTPQIAFARIFIDVGMLIALLSVCLTVPKAQAVRAQELGTAMRELARGQYDKRIQVDTEFGDLTQTAQAFNELAAQLKTKKETENSQNHSDIVELAEDSNQRDPGKHYNEAEQHSHHPELGAVAAIIPEKPKEPEDEEQNSSSDDHHRENISDNPIAQIEPSKTSNQDAMIMSEEIQEEPKASNPSKITQIPHNAQDLRQLFEEYSEALEFTKRPSVEFDEFKTTIDESVQALKESHNCQDVKFKVVVEDDNVALRPHLVR